MTAPEQATPVAAAETSNEKGSRQASPVPPGAVLPRKKGFEVLRERAQDRQAKLDRHRTSVLEGIGKLTKELAKLPEAEVNKRLAVRQKVKAFEDQLALIADEQSELDRQKEELARQEQQARVEEAVSSRNVLREEGIVIATQLRLGLLVVAELFNAVRELGERDRIQKDIIRSIAPQRITETPDFWSYEGSGIAPDLKAVLGQAIGELPRWHQELQRREQARGATA